MRVQRFLFRFWVLTGLILSAVTPCFAQVARTSTSAESFEKLMADIRAPRAATERLKANKNLQGKDVLTKPLDQLRIQKAPILNRSLKDLKRGGVDSGGGDQIGLEFIAELRQSIFDFALMNYDEKENFPWSDLAPYAITLNIVAIDTPIKVGGEITTRVAYNDLSSATIILQRGIWNSIRDRRVRGLIAMNQVLLMQQKKATGFAQQAYVSAVAQGINPLILWDGKERELTNEDRSATASHQCLWSYSSLQRVAKVLENEANFCAAKLRLPEQFQITNMHVEQLVARCETTCALKTDTKILAERCREYRDHLQSLLGSVQKIAPFCLKESK